MNCWLRVSLLGGLAMVAAGCPTPSTTVQVYSELTVSGRIDEDCLSRIFPSSAEVKSPLHGWFVMPVEDVFGPDRQFGGVVGIQVAEADQKTTTLRVVSEARADVRPISPEEWRKAETNNELAIGRILRECASPGDQISKACIRKGHPSSAACESRM
ncbi:hypothetical protein HPC49_35285 [Pyxidicoccus fallax]|uniref:Lipoprotein n=1 Tax=Pyxidicoccus fallax TaxID=394095 RepID=A0A848LPV1_9BACT|nr:hypothetical protein [Pyxidicoccus fallax]NMO19721.1 hypothetical protein [Pyxidicoccus fallax]NPC83475.1 hypothetical protein [Pyxidicoccus fallax]